MPEEKEHKAGAGAGKAKRRSFISAYCPCFLSRSAHGFCFYNDVVSARVVVQVAFIDA